MRLTLKFELKVISYTNRSGNSWTNPKSNPPLEKSYFGS